MFKLFEGISDAAKFFSNDVVTDQQKADCYRDGNIVEQNTEEAINHYKKAVRSKQADIKRLQKLPHRREPNYWQKKRKMEREMPGMTEQLGILYMRLGTSYHKIGQLKQAIEAYESGYYHCQSIQCRECLEKFAMDSSGVYQTETAKSILKEREKRLADKKSKRQANAALEKAYDYELDCQKSTCEVFEAYLEALELGAEEALCEIERLEDEDIPEELRARLTRISSKFSRQEQDSVEIFSEEESTSSHKKSTRSFYSLPKQPPCLRESKYFLFHEEYLPPKEEIYENASTKIVSRNARKRFVCSCPELRKLEEWP